MPCIGLARAVVQLLARGGRTDGSLGMMKRRMFLTLALVAPFSVALLRQMGVGSKYIEKNGWILKPEDL